MKRICFGSDHAGYKLKEVLKEWIKNNYPSVECIDKGCNTEESCDYADFAHLVAEEIKDDVIGVLLCGSANGVSIAANKHKGVRAALCWNREIVSLARQHNDANILSIPARFVTIEEAENMLQTFINTPFEGGRHTRRIEKIDK
jgi:ribose 5-phosphate isomerase B